MSVPRILDANANRAREALRVIEEAARFILDDAEVVAAVKGLRHEISAALADLPQGLGRRDVAGDVGTGLSTTSEMTRTSVHDVAAAAGKRLGEALRALEEYAKTIDPQAARRFERARYDGYDLEQRVVLALGSGRARQWAVCVLIGEAATGGRPWRDVAEGVAAARPDCIQLREKNLPDGVLLERARALVEMAGPGTAVIVNDRPDIALLAGAHGVHLGQGDLPCRAVRRLVGTDLVIGVSTSSLAEARQARRDGADYVGVGPMFRSTTKPRDAVAGPAVLAEIAAWDGLPHLAISGITPDNVHELVTVGCRGVAVSACVCAAPRPGVVIEALRQAVGTR